jgi:hypothetical protein
LYFTKLASSCVLRSSPSSFRKNVAERHLLILRNLTIDPSVPQLFWKRNRLMECVSPLVIHVDILEDGQRLSCGITDSLCFSRSKHPWLLFLHVTFSNRLEN